MPIGHQELEGKVIELSLWSKSSFGKGTFYGQILIDLASFNWNKYDGLEQMWRLRPRAPLNPFIVPYKPGIQSFEPKFQPKFSTNFQPIKFYCS